MAKTDISYSEELTGTITMSKDTPNEKTMEMLFTIAFTSAWRMSGLSLRSPTTVEEFVKGYDAVFRWLEGGRDIYLQFKRPWFPKTKQHYRVEFTPHQHGVLARYPCNSSFYVVPLIESPLHLEEIQKAVDDPTAFLRWFAVVSAHSLSLSPSAMTLAGLSNLEVRELPFREPRRGPNNETGKRIPRGYMWGNELLSRFETGSVGARLSRLAVDGPKSTPELSKGRGTRPEDDVLTPSRINEIVAGVKDSQLTGVILSRAR
jgi:hypothetical protein